MNTLPRGFDRPYRHTWLVDYGEPLAFTLLAIALIVGLLQ